MILIGVFVRASKLLGRLTSYNTKGSMVMIPRCYTVIAGEPDVGTSFVRAYNNIIARSHNFIVITSLYVIIVRASE